MAKRVPFSNMHQDISEISIYFTDTEVSLKLFFASAASFPKRFSAYTNDEVNGELNERLNELHLTASLSLFAAIEATFRIDYLQRSYKRKKDALSIACRDLYKAKQTRASLEDDIFKVWKDNTVGAKQLIADLKGAFKFRHWLAHGRYWNPKLGRASYDYETIYELAENVLSNFPFEGMST